MRRALPAAALLALAACAGAQRPAGAGARGDARCPALSARASAVLDRALDEYLEGMRRYAAARDGASTAPAEARARARAVEWKALHRPELERGCGAWAPDTLACALEADSARALGDCGPEAAALVSSYTDDVVAAFASSPLR
ncbi:MAG: hypothetical protein QM704_13970 [Anaeromyxobacteraceae bacterium]